ncbi:hypothetical protein MTR67_043012 [Solanum verrucosum]|uniref:Uncharacterized protein n=1 Tax=Solanum verrucosum TaxID=315347 RepID=A0AAF0UNN0_SOLVR|nr:hypothetical protein MTR67_043012 [Solanum verrucosum]
MGSLVAISVDKRPLARDIQRLANNRVQLHISKESVGLIAFIKARSSLVEQIRERQFDDEKLYLIQDKALRGESKEDVLDSDGLP